MPARPDPALYRLWLCPVCGHVEWLAPGEPLPRDYRCPLCGAGARTMLPLDDPRLLRHRVELEEVAPRVWRARKRPGFHADYEHFSYLLQHPQGVVLLDAPPLCTPEAVAAVLALGPPRLLVVSHGDFVAVAGHWARALGVPAWMGAGDEPLPGNLFAPDERVSERRALAADLELLPLPGHTPGSLGLHWPGAPAGPALLAGDALVLWPLADGGAQLALFQRPPVDARVRAALERPVALLGACTGTLASGAGPALARLLAAPEPCARPYAGETGGIRLEGVRVR